MAIGPADLTLAEGTSTIVYAWGSQAAGFELAVQTISSHSAPVRRPRRHRRPGGRRSADAADGAVGRRSGRGRRRRPPARPQPRLTRLGDRRTTVRPAAAAAVLGVALAVGVPTAWSLTRPPASVGAPVEQVRRDPVGAVVLPDGRRRPCGARHARPSPPDGAVVLPDGVLPGAGAAVPRGGAGASPGGRDRHEGRRTTGDPRCAGPGAAHRPRPGGRRRGRRGRRRPRRSDDHPRRGRPGRLVPLRPGSRRQRLGRDRRARRQPDAGARGHGAAARRGCGRRGAGHRRDRGRRPAGGSCPGS